MLRLAARRALSSSASQSAAALPSALTLNVRQPPTQSASDELLARLSEAEGDASGQKYAVRTLAELLVEGRGEEVAVLDLRAVPSKPSVDWFLFASARCETLPRHIPSTTRFAHPQLPTATDDASSGRSRSHMRTLARSVSHSLKQSGVLMFGARAAHGRAAARTRPGHVWGMWPAGGPPLIEGGESDEWMLVDGGRAVVSVLTREAQRDWPRPRDERTN